MSTSVAQTTQASTLSTTPPATPPVRAKNRLKPRPRPYRVRNETLCSKMVARTENWQQWLTIWNQTQEKELLLGLLHVAWDVCGEGNRKDCLLLLLRLADGHTKGYMYFCVNEGDKPFKCHIDYHAALSVCRLEIARKAFSVLCTKFFPQKHSGVHWIMGWQGLVNDVEVLDTLIDFVRVGKNELGMFHLLNRPTVDGHNRDVFLAFAKEFTGMFFKAEALQLEEGLCVKCGRRKHRILVSMLFLENLNEITYPQYKVYKDLVVMRFFRFITFYYCKQNGFASVEEAAAEGFIFARILLLVTNNQKHRKHEE